MTREEALRVLGLEATSTADEIRVAHRELAQMLHPDKFGGNKKLRARAEQQMKMINEARDVLLKGASGPSRGPARPGAAKGGRRTMDPAEIAFEAEARARAAETARLAVSAQARTLRERRGGMVTMAVVAGAVALLTSRMAGALGTLVFSIASMVCVWGIVDAVMLSNQAGVLQKRSAELLRQRDDARRIAREAREL